MHLLSCLLAASFGMLPAQAPSPGKVIEAKDGDVILVNDRASVRVVRRMQANVRVVYNATQRWLLLLVDQDTGAGPDGRVDSTFTFNELTGDWPLGERWEGRVGLDEYSVLGLPGAAGLSGLGLTTGGGLIQILGGPTARDTVPMFREPSAVATVTFMGSGRGGGGNQSFDVAEQMQAAVAARNAATRLTGVPARSAIDFRVGTAPDAPGSYPSAMAPVRVGGNVRAPARLEDAEPVLPETARQAGIRGVVILEITIGPDGRVTDAKVLRSMPLLDAAAIETARKWRYEPTTLNGAPVPVIMTVTVNFR